MSGRLYSGKPYGGIVLGSVMATMALAMTPLYADGLDQQVQVCAGCHGADGKPVDKTIPNIWGQQTGYL
jgi:cytochrome c553